MLRLKKILFQVENNIDSIIKQDTPVGKDLWNLLLQQHSADIAFILSSLDSKYSIKLFKNFPKPLSIRVFKHLTEKEQADFLVNLDVEHAATILKRIPVDKLTALFDFLPDEDLKKLLKLMQKKQRTQIISRLNFSPKSAGRIMDDVVTLQKDFTVKKSILLLQKLDERRELLQTIYVTDEDNKLVGHIKLDDLILNKPDAFLKNILHRDELIINVYQDQTEVANLMQHYGLWSAPVVDEQDNFLGVITTEDLLDIMEDEASEEVYRMSGITPAEHNYFETSIWSLIGQRSFWLISLLLLQSFSGFILTGYQNIVDKYFIITMFLTMLIGTGGNAGNQSSALVIRGLATGEMNKKNGLKVLFRELQISILMALLLTGVAFARVYLFRHDILSSLVVSLALFIIVVFSMLLGTLLPLMLARFNLDPAHSAAPFLATLMDILGVLIYCFVVSKLLG